LAKESIPVPGPATALIFHHGASSGRVHVPLTNPVDATEHTAAVLAASCSSTSRGLELQTLPQSSTMKKFKKRTIRLGNGEVLDFDESDIPEVPPTVPKGIEEVACVWDDSHPSWAMSSPLMIKDIPIALKHWGSVYQRLSTPKKEWWTVMKMSLFNCQVSFPCLTVRVN